MEKQDCIFCKIIKGEIPSVKIYEDDKCMVVLDKFPATKGQALVIAKEHKDYIFELDDKTYSRLFEVAREISKAIDKALNTIRTCIVVQGFEIPHVHIRLHPAYEKKLLLKGKIAEDNQLKEIGIMIKNRLKSPLLEDS